MLRHLISRDKDREAIEFIRRRILGGSAGGSYPFVANFAALPSAVANNGKVYIVLNSQGTWWLPGNLGGNYYSKGFYYSDGADWQYLGSFPYQASQSTVNAESNNDQFVTPATLGAWIDQRELELSQIRGITISSSPPSSPQVNDLWIDIS